MEETEKSREQQVDLAHLINGQQEPGRRNNYLEKRQDTLAEQLKDGSQEAAAELVDIYYKQIYWFMRRLGHSRQASEDLTQDSFFQAWQHIGQLRSGEALNSWLYRIAGNVSRLYRRRNKGKEAVNIEDIDEPGSSEGINDVGHYEQLGRLRIAVVKLPIKLREAVVLHYMQHLTIAQAAEAAGVRKGTFKSRLNRALKALRKQVV